MTKFELQNKGEGRFELSGDMSFATANQILKASEPQFRQHASIEVDLSGVNRADSAGLALMLEWKAQVEQRGGEVRFIDIPANLMSVARTSEVDTLV